jgi:hypothetical protein
MMLMPGPAKILVLEEEIAYAKSQLQPHDTGHINTAISWMEHRKRELEKKYLGELYEN